MASFVDRVVGAARLDVRTYEEVEADPKSIIQAVLVVGLASASFAAGTAIQSTSAGITGIQLDLKIDGISDAIIRATMAQSREARMEILRTMLTTISRPKDDISPWAPRLMRTRIDPDKIIRRISYDHPMFTLESIAAQARQRELNNDRTFFCGAYWRSGFHEDGVVSALDAVGHFEERLDRGELHLRRAG